jgi:hypothetical protein
MYPKTLEPNTLTRMSATHRRLTATKHREQVNRIMENPRAVQREFVMMLTGETKEFSLYIEEDRVVRFYNNPIEVDGEIVQWALGIDSELTRKELAPLLKVMDDAMTSILEAEYGAHRQGRRA